MTWLLVRISPSEVSTMPVPADSSPWYFSTDTTVTMPLCSVDVATCALVCPVPVPEPAPVPDPVPVPLPVPVPAPVGPPAPTPVEPVEPPLDVLPPAAAAGFCVAVVLLSDIVASARVKPD